MTDLLRADPVLAENIRPKDLDEELETVVIQATRDLSVGALDAEALMTAFVQGHRSNQIDSS
jgi:hypothetical protein